MIRYICAPLVAALTMFAVSGCVSMPVYVDPALADLTPADRVQIADKRPVQLVFIFRTNGAKNSGATNRYAVQAAEAASSSGLFSQVSSSPAPGGAVLSIMIDHVAENTLMQGLMTGLTLGLTNSSVSDFYVATATYTPGPAGAAITAERKHAIHSPSDANGVPEGIQPSKSFESALETVTRQLLEHTLNDIARDPLFQSTGSQQAAAPSRS